MHGNTMDAHPADQCEAAGNAGRIQMYQLDYRRLRLCRLKEKGAAMSARSSDPIDYTNFGELSNIIEFNWETFSDTFKSRKGLVAVLSRLNLLRAPIAQCSELSQDEVVRLKLTHADFFRLME